MSEFYNNEEQKFSSLLSDLKKLPKIEAPENFEFNLMTRIENKNFGQVEEERPKFNLLKFLAPSAAVLATVLLFFIFYPQKNEIPTQIANQPKTTDSQSIVGNSANKNFESLFSTDEKKSSNQKREVVTLPNQNIAQNPQAVKPPVQFNQRRSVAVDDYISGTNSNQNSAVRSNIVNSGDEPLVDGFLIEKKTDKKTIEKFRSELDSLKKAQTKADSLKKARK
ncbi:MAG: hypothetical protein Q8L04_16705 [Ignavibacteria bacterium]|nr:hypothetical protein [Ignavibacteria bacterium]